MGIACEFMRIGKVNTYAEAKVLMGYQEYQLLKDCAPLEKV